MNHTRDFAKIDVNDIALFVTDTKKIKFVKVLIIGVSKQ